MQMDVITTVISHINNNLQLFDQVRFGQLGRENGISAQIGPNRGAPPHFDGARFQKITMLLLSKHTNQKTALEALFLICNYLEGAGAYPVDEGCEITAIKTATTPNYVDASQSGGQYIFSALVNIEFYAGSNFINKGEMF